MVSCLFMALAVAVGDASPHAAASHDFEAPVPGHQLDPVAAACEDTTHMPHSPELSEANLVALLCEPEHRAQLLTSMHREQGSYLPLTNRYEQLAARSDLEPDVLRGVANQLLDAECIELLSPLVFNASMPEDVLLRLCEEGKCLDALGHRRLPRAILEKLVELHEYPEAVLTLALELYADPAVSSEEFTVFLRARTHNDWMLRALAGGTPSKPEKERAYWEVLAHNPESSAVRTVLVALLEDPACATEEFAHVFRAHAREAWTLEVLLLGRASTPAKEALVHEACEHHANRERLREVRRFADQIRRAGSADLTADEAEKLRRTNAPEVLVRLAENPRSPDSLLSELCELRGTRRARAIRNRASRVLRMRQKSK